jgi:RNA polymerase sigma-70 factor (ECF subfamily)
MKNQGVPRCRRPGGVLTVGNVIDCQARTPKHRERDGVEVDLDRQTLRCLEPYRHELTAHCRQLLGSWSEADDAVQETLVRAWRGFDQFEGRSSVGAWLHRIATNVCLDMRRAKQRRARPMDPGSWPVAGGSIHDGRREGAWLEPVPVGNAPSGNDDPADRAVAREALRRALAAAFVRLPPRQQSVLILREVLRWHASEVAELHGTSVIAVNSSLGRARSNLAARAGTVDDLGSLDDEQLALLHRHVDAFERCDVDSLVSLMG